MPNFYNLEKTSEKEKSGVLNNIIIKKKYH